MKLNAFLLDSNENTNYLYTKGGEFSLNGLDYVGEYHYFNKVPRTGPVPSNESRTLLKPYKNKDNYVYDKVLNFRNPIQTYIEPVPYIFIPTDSDYVSGFASRYFVQKINTTESYPIEIDNEQYSTIQTPGGIDGGLYNSATISWKLTGYQEDIQTYNRREVLQAKKQIPELEYIIKSYLDFAKITYFQV